MPGLPQGAMDAVPAPFMPLPHGHSTQVLQRACLLCLLGGKQVNAICWKTPSCTGTDQPADYIQALAQNLKQNASLSVQCSYHNWTMVSAEEHV